MAFLFMAGSIQAKVRKAVYIIIDGVPADMIERLDLPAIQDIASEGTYSRLYVGGTVGDYDETPTISAVGYTDLLTSTWVNKHNVWGNHNISPNYNYWTIFRIAKEQKKNFTTGIFSSWIDNRTVLIGEGKPETGNLSIDYVRDGYELDEKAFPKKPRGLHIFDIDEHVSKEAASCIKEDAPDLSWVYLWYTDDAGHEYGNGEVFDNSVIMADRQIGRIWDAVKYREENFNEDWMIVVTTDHGRTDNGLYHGAQSERERITWMATNRKVNDRVLQGGASILDIAPSISRFLGFKVPRDVRWEQDGMPFIGKVDIMDMTTVPSGDNVELRWKSVNGRARVKVWAAAGNNFKEGGKDKWIKVGSVRAKAGSYTVDLSKLPKSTFYKFVLEAPHNHLNKWYPVGSLRLPGWAVDVKKGINNFLLENGTVEKGKRYAVFDFDNTTSIFDIQYQMVPYQLGIMAFNIGRDGMKGALSEDLTRMDRCGRWISDISSDYAALYDRYGPFSSKGVSPSDTASLHKDPLWLDFATKMLGLYRLVYEVEPNEICLKWVTSWFKDMTGDEIYALSKASHETFSKVETSVVRWGGGTPCEWTSGISVPDELRELWKSLNDNGIDVWVCSGSQLEQVRAAVDVFGLHDYCTGILAVPSKYDGSTAGYLALPDGEWKRDDAETGGFTWCEGKVKAIDSVLLPRYGHGPDAAFMDSEGDFHFCTEYSSLKLVVCFNTADKGPYDGAGLVAEAAIYERDCISYDYWKATAAGDTFYLLQGRDENGMRRLIPDNRTIKYGAGTPVLFRDAENQKALDSFKAKKLSVKELFDDNALGRIEGFTGYHSR